MKTITTLLIMLLITVISHSQTILLEEDFNGATVPEGWQHAYSTGNGSQYWTFGSGVVPGSVDDFTTNAAIFDDNAAGNTGNNDNVWLYTPAINGSDYGQITLHYDYALNVIDGNGETLTVAIWDNSATSWIPLKVYNTDTDPTADFIDITEAINAYPGINPTAIYIGFGYNDNTSWGYGAGIDNVLITGSVQPENDLIFVHTATTDNIASGYMTRIDHPELNNNPDAKIVVSHNYNPGGGSGVYNNNIDSVWYSGGSWYIYNEDTTINMEEGASFNVYIRGNDSNVITHIASPENVGSTDFYTVIDNPLINGNPDATLVMYNYWSPYSVYNNNNYGFYYNGTNWIIYGEATTIPTNAAFNVIVSPSDDNVVSFKHQSTAANTSNNYTIMDHPLLNGKPNAVFVFSHNWGSVGDSSNVVIDKVFGAWYTGSNWAIYTEDISDMPDNALFNIVVQTSEVASINTNELVSFNIYPNPVTDMLNVDSKETLTNISIFNLLGQEIKSFKPNTTNYIVDLTDLETGVYFVKVTANNKQSSKKIIKQ